MRKYLSAVVGLVLALCLSVCTAPTVRAEAPLTRAETAQLIVDTLDLKYDESMAAAYADVPRDSPYYEAVSICANQGIMSGMGVNTFRPSTSVTRAEAATYLYRAGLPYGTPETVPPDVGSYNWYYEAVCAVLKAGVMSAREDGNFYPGDSAVRSDVNTSAIAELFDPTTSDTPQFDLVNGSITISRNIKGVMVFTQGDTVWRTAGSSAIVRQSSTAAPTANTITVESGEASLMIVDLNIESVAPPIAVSEGAKLTLNLLGSSTLKASDSAAGISIPEGAELTIQGSGAVTATGGRYGGIGGRYGSTVTINSGTVTATGSGTFAAGINGSGGTVTINGGTVTATGGDYGAAGINGSDGTVTINGGTVTASGYYCAIGGNGGYDNQYGCDSIVISENAEVHLSHESSNGFDCQERIDYGAFPDEAALAGNSAVFSEIASGASGLSYQWQTSADNTTWTDIDGQTAATVAIPMSAENDGRYYRCRLTNGWGNVVYTDSARAYVLAFTRQPQSVETSLNDVASLAVTSSCANVAYLWQRSYDEGATWSNVSGEVYSTLLVNATLSENDALYRCVITAANRDEVVSDAARITVTSAPATYYTTRYYAENDDCSGYVCISQAVTEAAAGTVVTAANFTPAYCTENTAMGTHAGTVTADNSLVLSRYYDRVAYMIDYETNGGAALGADSVKYGTALMLPTPSRVGYTFAGWYRDAALTQTFEESAMPGENLTLYAKWSLVGAGRGIEYRINGITLRDSGYQSIGAISRGSFYAEVSVTNLRSTSLDTLILAAYDANGRQLGISFLYANPQIGQTFVLGTLIGNSGGEVARIKAFMVPMLGGVTPLAETAEFAP